MGVIMVYKPTFTSLEIPQSPRFPPRHPRECPANRSSIPSGRLSSCAAKSSEALPRTEEAWGKSPSPEIDGKFMGNLWEIDGGFMGNVWEIYRKLMGNWWDIYWKRWKNWEWLGNDWKEIHPTMGIIFQVMISMINCGSCGKLMEKDGKIFIPTVHDMYPNSW